MADGNEKQVVGMNRVAVHGLNGEAKVTGYRNGIAKYERVEDP